MTSDPSDSPEPTDAPRPVDASQRLDEVASAYVDGQLDDAERRAAELDQPVIERARGFSALRSELHDGAQNAAEERDTDAVAAIERDISAALAVYDELYRPPTIATTTATAQVTAVATVEHGRVASLDQRRQRRVRQRTLSFVGIAAAVALAVVGITTLTSRNNDTKSSTSATTNVLPAIAEASGTAPANRSPAPEATPTEQQQATVGVEQVPAGASGDAAATNSGAGDSSANASGGVSGTAAAGAVAALPVLSTDDDVVVFIQQRFSAESAATTAGTAANVPVGPGGSPVLVVPQTTIASASIAATSRPTIAADTRTTTAGTTAGSVSTSTALSPSPTPSSTPCDTTADAIDLGPVFFNGQPADVIVHRRSDGVRLGTVYGPNCSVLTQVQA